MAVGRSTARAIELDAGLEPGTIGTLYHGVPDVKHHAPGTRPGGRRILNIARHDPVKGIDVLLEALATRTRHHPRADRIRTRDP